MIQKIFVSVGKGETAMRLIDGDKIGLNDIEIVMCEGSYKKALEMLIDKINNAPTVDAFPVVRCKDCAYYENCLDTYMIPADCCPQGKRKEETE